MIRALPLLLAPLPIAASAVPCLAADLDREVAALVAAAKMPKATVAVSVRDVSSGEELVELRDALPLIPASNMKLLTSGAALAALGPDFRFRTTVVLAGGDLVVRGAGDPAFGDPELLAETVHRGADGDADDLADVDALLDVWVDAIARSGIREVGEVVVDDRIFDRERVHPDWPKDQLSNHYCAEVAGLNFHGNCVHLCPKPRPGGRPDPGRFVPNAAFLVLENRATSATGAKQKHDPWLAHAPGETTTGFTLHGNVREPMQEPIRIAMKDAPAFFAALLAEKLQARGIRVAGHRVARSDEPAEGGREVAPAISTPIDTVLARANVDSANLHAEALLKRLGNARSGEPGSWRNGTAALRAVIAERIDSTLLEGTTFADGSGLSRRNRVRADLMTAWIAAMLNDPRCREGFRESLAVGRESGTLVKRFRGLDLRGCVVRAKTGYINGVSCLSGVVEAPDGRARAFSVLCNGVTSVADAKTLQERIVAAIARDLAEEPVPTALGG